jgi:hypothetical protein
LTHVFPLRLHRSVPADTVGEPITAGVPFPAGVCRDVSLVRVRDERGVPLPVQARPTALWGDGSVRWALLDLQADVGVAGTTLQVGVATDADEAAPSPAVAVHVSGDGEHVTVDTATLRLRVRRGATGPFDDLWVHGRSVVDRAPTLRVRDHEGRSLAVRVTAWHVDAHGPVRAEVGIDGRIGDAADPVALVRWRLEAFAGATTIRLRTTLHNPRAAAHPGGIWELGDPGSVFLRDVVLALSPAGAGSVHAAAAIELGEQVRPVALPFAIHQESSGGASWDSPVHVSRTGRVPLRYRGYRLDAGGDVRVGHRATPLVVAGRDAAAVGVTSARFWEVFPKAYEVHEDGTVAAAILPEMAEPHELQGGEKCSHDLALSFGLELGAAQPPAWAVRPSAPSIDPTWWATTQVISGILPASSSPDTYDTLVQAALDGQDTFFTKRERIDEYGWRNFGDLYADHENGPLGDDVTRVSHYNNQYDPIAGCLAQWARSGDPRWWTLADELATHVANVDIYWTDRDWANYNGGLFWHTSHYTDAGRSTHRSYPRAEGVHGGGPSNEHCYSYGLMLHHFLTGDPDSGGAARRLAEWVMAIDDGTRQRFPLPLLAGGASGRASSTASDDYHGPGRGAANCILALLNGWELTGDERFLTKADELVRRCIHPADDLPARDLLNRESRWSYVVFLQVLGRYLAARAWRGHAEPMWSYARASLLHYARWMTSHEHPYLEHPDQLEFPNETWAAQDMRKAEVFDLAAVYAGDLQERHVFAARAETFFAAALRDVSRFETRRRTRPVVLLLSYGFARAWHERHGPSLPILAHSAIDYGRPERFVPQKTVAIRRLKWLAAAGVIALTAGAAALVSWLI